MSKKLQEVPKCRTLYGPVLRWSYLGYVTAMSVKNILKHILRSSHNGVDGADCTGQHGVPIRILWI